MRLIAESSPQSFRVGQPCNVDIVLRSDHALQIGDTVEVQFPNSWLLYKGPSYTRALQAEDPEAEHFISVSAPATAAAFTVEITQRHLYFPEGAVRHGRLIVATLTEGEVPANTPIRLRYANTFAAVLAETETVWVRVNGEAPEVAPILTTLAGPAASMRILVPSVVEPDETFDVLIVSLDQFENCACTRYDDQQLACDDGMVIADRLSFTGSIRVPVSITEPGVYRFLLGEARSNAVSVERNGQKVYWGDIHIHTKVSHDGQGNQPYQYAREVSGLDFASVTDHVEALGERGYAQILDWAETAYVPGQFVTLPADERIPPITGHHNIYFRDIDAFLHGASMDGKRVLCGDLDPARVMVLPHHTGIIFSALSHYRAAVAWDVWDDRGLRPAMEIYSHHGQSELYAPQHVLAYEFNRMRKPERRANTSSPGSHYSQDVWKAGRRIGIYGSSDEHFGQGGRRHGGIAAVRTDALTREDIFDAIRLRRCYATTGERIFLDFAINDTPMGQEMASAPGSRVSVRLTVRGTDLLLRVEILRYRFGIDQEFQPILSEAPHPERYDATYAIDDEIIAPCLYYARVTQEPLAWPDMAWSSPVWIDLA